MNTQDRIDQIIVELYANELSVAKIAREFGVTKNYVYMINSGKCGHMDDYKYPIRTKGYSTREKPTDKYDYEL